MAVGEVGCERVLKRFPENAFWKTSLNVFPCRNTQVLISQVKLWNLTMLELVLQTRRIASGESKVLYLKHCYLMWPLLASSWQSSQVRALWDEAHQWQLSLVYAYHKQDLKKSIVWRNTYFYFVWASNGMLSTGQMYESVKLCQSCVWLLWWTKHQDTRNQEAKRRNAHLLVVILSPVCQTHLAISLLFNLCTEKKVKAEG